MSEPLHRIQVDHILLQIVRVFALVIPGWYFGFHQPKLHQLQQVPDQGLENNGNRALPLYCASKKFRRDQNHIAGFPELLCLLDPERGFVDQLHTLSLFGQT